ncbi:hypothetical protein K2F54_14875 [Cryobacterium sp. 1639]|uniref:hypothetical protein n=1 Tax=Cryobacterium inferilacus TaxID=2866629 RepID=UPI001C72FDC6|nr:hypothetical protein [Cryobacterium sp. 1639]MBX0301256.1 hypothetical protein [Cryobacterium sp. 1639]
MTIPGADHPQEVVDEAALPRPLNPWVWLGLLLWLPAILCGVAIAWCGVATAGRAAAAITAIAVVVVGPAFATAVSAAAGTRMLARNPDEMIDYAAAVFRQVLLTPHLTLRPLIGTVVVALLGLALVAVRQRVRRSAVPAP